MLVAYAFLLPDVAHNRVHDRQWTIRQEYAGDVLQQRSRRMDRLPEGPGARLMGSAPAGH